MWPLFSLTERGAYAKRHIERAAVAATGETQRPTSIVGCGHVHVRLRGAISRAVTPTPETQSGGLQQMDAEIGVIDSARGTDRSNMGASPSFTRDALSGTRWGGRARLQLSRDAVARKHHARARGNEWGAGAGSMRTRARSYAWRLTRMLEVEPESDSRRAETGSDDRDDRDPAEISQCTGQSIGSIHCTRPRPSTMAGSTVSVTPLAPRDSARS